MTADPAARRGLRAPPSPHTAAGITTRGVCARMDADVSDRANIPQSWQVIHADVRAGLASLPEQSAHVCVTSPPYWGLRDYGVDGQIGLEQTPDEYVAAMVGVFREVRRVLRDDATCWVNLGDSYSGAANSGGAGKQDTQYRGVGLPTKRGTDVKEKDLIGIPWRVAFALQADGWYLRQDIIWHKPNPMPESVTDRCTKAHEYLFLLSKRARYYYDAGAIAEEAAYAGQMRGGSTNRYEQNAAGMDNKVYDERNKRSVWSIQTQPYKHAHFATFPEALVEPCIKAGSPVGGMVLDPFSGSGTTGVVALKQARSYVGVELNPEYVAMSRRRLADVSPLLAREVA